jgi:hypothetical protein
MRSALAGLPVGRVIDAGRQADVVLRVAAADDPARLGRLRSPARAARLVALASVADVEMGPLRADIVHEDGVRTVSIGVNVAGRPLAAVAGDVARVVGETPLPPRVYAEVGGEYAAAAAARARLLGLGALALVGIFVLLVSTSARCGSRASPWSTCRSRSWAASPPCCSAPMDASRSGRSSASSRSSASPSGTASSSSRTSFTSSASGAGRSTTTASSRRRQIGWRRSS